WHRKAANAQRRVWRLVARCSPFMRAAANFGRGWHSLGRDSCERPAERRGLPINSGLSSTTADWLLMFLGTLFFVGLQLHQLGERSRIAHLNLDHPAFAVGIVVEDFEVVGQLAVDLDHLARHRAVQ